MEFSEPFTKYEFPKHGIFEVSTDEYKLGIGWLQKEEQKIIIGETKHCYVYKLLPSGHGEWVGDKVIQLKYILPVGIHKTRLVKWTAGQLTLF